MVQYTKQDARSVAPQCLDLESYDAAAMLADLGPQRLKDLPLRGRVVYQTEAPSMPKLPGLQNEVIAKWSQYIEKEAEELGKKGVDDVGEDGLGLGGSYRGGPNYRPIPVYMRSGMGPKLPGPARFRAGARGPTPGTRRRFPSPPPIRDCFLGPKPRNPTFEARPFRGQLVTRHVNTKALAGFGDASGSAASATSHHLSIRPEPSVATGVAAVKWNTGVLTSSSSLLSLKETTSVAAIVNPNSRISQLVSDVSNTSQGTSKLSDVTTSTMPSSPQLQSSAASPGPSRSTSRTSSIFGPPAHPQAKPRWLRSAAVPIKPPRSRDTIRPAPEASKNHWNLASLVLQTAEPPNGFTKHEAKSSSSTIFVSTDEAKPQLAPTPLQVPSVTEQKPELDPTRRVAGFATVANLAASTNPNALTGLVTIPSGQKPDGPSDAQPVTKQSTIPSLPGNKNADQTSSGLSTSKYATPAPSGLSGSKYAAPKAPDLPASKYASPPPPALPGSRYTGSTPSGLSASKYATPAAPGLSASKYATNGSTSTRSAVSNALVSPGLSENRSSDVAPPRIASSGALSGLAGSKYAPQQLRAASRKEVMKPQDPAPHLETPAVPPGGKNEVSEVMGVKKVIKEVVGNSQAEQDEPAIKTEEGATIENDAAIQLPMPASQRLLDSIAARYKFASPKQVNGLARRYGTMIVVSKDSPTKAIAPQEREIGDATRAFQALFISRGRRVLRQPQLPVSRNMAS